MQGTQPCPLRCEPPSPTPTAQAESSSSGQGTNAPLCFRNPEPTLTTKFGVFWISFFSQTITKKKSAIVPPFSQTSSPRLLSGLRAPAAAGTAGMLDGAGGSGGPARVSSGRHRRAAPESRREGRMSGRLPAAPWGARIPDPPVPGAAYLTVVASC